MAPTLQDVSMLLGLPLAGDPIGPLQAPADWQEGIALRFQGILDGAGPFTSEAHGPKLDWLLNYQFRSMCFTFTYVGGYLIYLHRFTNTCFLVNADSEVWVSRDRDD